MHDKYRYAGQESMYRPSIYRWGGPIPAVWFKTPGKGGLRGLADVLDPPQNVGRGQLVCRMSGGVHGPAHLADFV
jgi:hypothetical protein